MKGKLFIATASYTSVEAIILPNKAKGFQIGVFFNTERDMVLDFTPVPQYALGNLLTHGILQFAMHFAFRCVLLRSLNRGIHR